MGRAGALVIAGLVVCQPARAAAADRAPSPPSASPEHPFDTVRFGIWGSTWSGTRLEGLGSVGRVARPAADLELSVRRYFSSHFGFDFRLMGFPVRDDTYAYLRGDLGLDVLLARWQGGAPGGVTAVLGLGGDTGRYPFAGRVYPRAGLRVRVHPGPSSTVEVGVELLPAAAAIDGRVVQHRAELAFGWWVFQSGFRVSHTFHTVGDPERTFMIQELGLFVGVGLLR